MAAAAADAAKLRQSMKTPPLFEPPPSRASHVFDAPTRQSIIFTQPVIDPEYRNSTIIHEPAPRRTRPGNNRDSAFLSDPANRHSTFLEQPSRQAGGARADPSMRHSAFVGDRPIRKPVRRNPRQRHTIVDPPAINITRESLKEGSLPSAAGAPARPPMKSQVSDTFGLNDTDILPQHRPSVAARSESTLVNQPLVKSQLRPNADQIRKRRQSRASKVASTPLSSSFGVGISSMTHGGNNVGLKEMSYGNFGMNQNFNLVNNRTSQYMATQREEESDDTVVEQVDRMQKQHKVKKTKKWIEVLYNWARMIRHTKPAEAQRSARKDMVDSTPI